jgi:hypothetical protein
MLSLNLHLVFLFGFFLPVEGRVVKDWIIHELLLYQFHTTHNWSRVTFFNDIDMVVLKVYLLVASFAKLLLG